MSATATSPSAMQRLHSRMRGGRRSRIGSRIARLAGRFLLVAMAVGVAWVLVSRDVAGESEAGCHRRSYRDPVTGQQMGRRC